MPDAATPASTRERQRHADAHQTHGRHRTDGRELALGKIDDSRDVVDHDEPDGDQTIEGTVSDPRDDQLEQAGPPNERNEGENVLVCFEGTFAGC